MFLKRYSIKLVIKMCDPGEAGVLYDNQEEILRKYSEVSQEPDLGWTPGSGYSRINRLWEAAERILKSRQAVRDYNPKSQEKGLLARWFSFSSK